MFLTFIAVGLFSGLLSGLLGLGGGIIVVPCLLEIFKFMKISTGLTTELAVGSSLGILMFTTCVTTYRYHHHRFVRWDTTKRLMLPMGFGALFGIWVGHFVGGDLIKGCFSAFVIFIAFRLWHDEAKQTQKPAPSLAQLTTHGFMYGTLSGLMGVGGGALLVPFLAGRGFPMKEASGTSAATVMVTTLFGAIGAAMSGYVQTKEMPLTIGFLYLPAVFWTAIGSFLSISVGVKIALKLSNRRLKHIFSFVLVIIALHMMF